MIKLVKVTPSEYQRSAKVHGGDTDIYAVSGYLMHSSLVDIRELYSIPMCYFHGSPWHGCMKANVDSSPLELIRHECPIVKQCYRPFVPIALLTADPAKYQDRVNPMCKGMILDKDWCAQTVYDDPEAKELSGVMNKITTFMLGSSYQMGILPSDGFSELQWFVAKLDNGDYLYGPSWVWYNK